MKEQSINTETAKLAKEKGLPESPHFAYLEADDLYFPTQSQLQAWLRKEYNAKVWCSPNYDEINETEGWFYNIVFKKGDTTYSIISQGNTGLNYEEALEKGLKRVLKLI